MANWLRSARNKLRQPASIPTSESFQRTCLCGNVMRGERGTAAVEITCAACRRSYFLLPVDPYPRPRGTRTVATPEVAASEDKSAANTAKRDSSKNAGSSKNGEAEGTQARSPASATGVAREDSALWWQDQRRRVVGSLRRIARPQRLIVGGILVVLILTGVGLWYRARVNSAQATLVTSERVAEEAIADQDLLAAEAALSDAVRSLRILGHTDARARGIRQRYEEVRAINNLTALPPTDLAAEAALSIKTPQHWSERFAASYAGQWIIVDAPVLPSRDATAVPVSDPKQNASDTEGAVSGDAHDEEQQGTSVTPPQVYPVLLGIRAGNVPVHFEIPATDRALVLDELVANERVILALQYDRWTLEEDVTGAAVWVVRFNPRSVVIWASADLAALAGFENQEPTFPLQPVLEQQAKQLKLATGESSASSASDSSQDNNASQSEDET